MAGQCRNQFSQTDGPASRVSESVSRFPISSGFSPHSFFGNVNPVRSSAMDKRLPLNKKGVRALTHTRAAAFLIILFITTRLFVFTGFPFSMNFLEIGMQLHDPLMLKKNLFQTLLYGHIQPPLFNAFVGGVLKVVPDTGAALKVFASLYLLIGLLLVLGVYSLAVNLGAARGWSLAAASVYVFWPPNILEQIFKHPPPEKWLSYDYPVMLLLLAMALSMAMYRNSRKIRWLTSFLLLSVMVVWTRPFFHSLYWFIPTMALAMWAVRSHRRRKRLTLLGVAIVALVLSLTPAVKNRVLYGWFTDSSFTGMNIASRTLFLSPETVRKEVEKGAVTPLALIPRFSEPEIYLDYYGEKNLTGKDLLDDVDKSTGYPNWDHIIMVRASREYGANTWTLLRAYPLELIKTTINGVYIFFGFESHRYLWPLGSAPWGFWNVTFGQARVRDIGSFLRLVVVPIIFAIAFFNVIVQLYKGREDPFCLFLLFFLTYTFAVSNIAELGHNNLFRKQIDPVLFAGSALWLTRYLRSRKIPPLPLRSEIMS